MILDSFTLDSIIFQVTYEESFLLWDRAGEIAASIHAIWPDLKLEEGRPEKQILKGKGVTVQTGLTSATITIKGSNALDSSHIQRLKNSFDVWRQKLDLIEASRISTLATYKKEFQSLKEANSELINLNLARWPDTKVFDQPMDTDRNGVELFYRFEDENSFSTIKFKAEKTNFIATLDPSFVDEPEIRKTKNEFVIIFDRGLLGTVSAEKFRVEDWLKGFQHILRRDIEKITKV